jgi:GntR family transcriptional repressor for pyruvate dehydrogenase complex
LLNLQRIQPLDRLTDKASDSLYMQIVDRIRQWLREGKLKEGDLLPSERDLAQMFDVSRVPVREALKVLEFLGAVQHVRGRGVFLKNIKMDDVLNQIDFMIVDPTHALADLFEAREAIECQATYLAAQRRTTEDILALDGIMIEMEKHIALGNLITESSMKFHTAVVAASHNMVLIKVNEFLADLLRYSRQRSLSYFGRHQTVVKHHAEVLARIKAEDPAGAATAMREHLADAKRLLVEPAQNGRRKA